MLKKLYKYDWKSVSMLLLVLHGVLLAYSIIGRLMIAVGDSTGLFNLRGNSPGALIISAIYFLAYVIFLIGIVMATILYMASRMQKNLFSQEGYLTNTLPVSPGKILTSKILVFWTWSAIDFLCVALSILILVSFTETIPEIIEDFQIFFSALFGFHGIDVMLEVLTVVLGLFIEYFLYFTSLILFSICLGSLFKTHKTLGALVAFFGINIAQSMIMLLLVLLFSPLSFFTTTVTTENGTVISQSGGYGLYFSLAWLLLLSIGFFFGSRYILTKKLNLD